MQMNEKIKSLEAQLLEEKSWQLKGEVTGQKRPENSLLEEMLLFDHAVKMGKPPQGGGFLFKVLHRTVHYSRRHPRHTYTFTSASRTC